MKRVHCLGVLVVDALTGPLTGYPEPKKHTQVTTEYMRFIPGGGAANMAVALRRMGLSTAVFSKVGRDLTGDFLAQELERQGVDTAGICRSASDTTPFTFVGVHADGDRTFIHTPGANTTFTADDLDVDRLLGADFLVYPDLWVLPRLDGQPAAEILAEAQRRGVVTVLDECWGFGPEREILELMLPHCDFVLPSVDDVAAIYPGESPEKIVEILLFQGAKTVALKMGAQGCLLAHVDQRFHVPALPARVMDTTGAGDCWDAGFIAGLAHDESLVASARLGAACAAYCIEAVGASAGVPDYASVRQRAGIEGLTRQ